MRWVNLLFCCLLLAFTVVGAATPLLASDLGSPRNERTEADDDESPEVALGEYCHSQQQICRKICNLRSRFDDRFDGCPQSCESREIRCARSGCYRWSEPEFLIAERFGGAQCAQ